MPDVQAFDDADVERAAAGLQLRLPRGPHRGRAGDVRAASTGASMELADFRPYHPGDDLRHIDWNAVARTDEWVVRVRHDEVAPRVEVWLDTSASMGTHPAKARCARMVAWWLCLVAQHRGLEPVLLALGSGLGPTRGSEARGVCHGVSLDGMTPLDEAIARAPLAARCGLRLVVSDLLIEQPPRAVLERLWRSTAGLTLVQVLDAEELDPTPAEGARLIDAESKAHLEHLLSPQLIDTYRGRLAAHQAVWSAAANAHGAGLQRVDASASLGQLVRTSLAPLVEAVP